MITQIYLTYKKSLTQLSSKRYIVPVLVIIPFLIIHPLKTSCQEKFYTYYNKGQEYMNSGDYLRAIEEFKSAASMEFEDTKKKRTYGTRFIKYFPHREIGIAYFNLGEYDDAKKELELSFAYQQSKSAKEYLQKLGNIDLTAFEEDKSALEKIKKIEDEKEKLERERELVLKTKAEEEKKLQEQEERLKKEKELTTLAKKEKIEKLKLEELKLEKQREQVAKEQAEMAKKEKELDEKRNLLEKQKESIKRQVREFRQGRKTLHVETLTYDPLKVTRVGSRLSVAVMPFESKGDLEDIEELITEKLIAELVNLRRFRVIERRAMNQILKEQKLGVSGVVDEETAIEMGKIAGADAIVLGSCNLIQRFVTIQARLIDVETSETIVAREVQSDNTDIRSIEDIVENLAVKVYNDIPLVEGVIVNVEPELVYLDIGNRAGIRKGTKCVAFREGDQIVHPVTGEVLGKKVSKLGELIVVQVQDKLSKAKFLKKEQEVEIGDRVVVK